MIGEGWPEGVGSHDVLDVGVEAAGVGLVGGAAVHDAGGGTCNVKQPYSMFNFKLWKEFYVFWEKACFPKCNAVLHGLSAYPQIKIVTLVHKELKE